MFEEIVRIAVECFVLGLHKDLEAVMMGLTPSSLEAAISVASDFEKRFDQRQNLHAAFEIPAQYRRVYCHAKDNEPAIIPGRLPKNPNQRRFDQDLENIRCYECKQMGHYACESRLRTIHSYGNRRFRTYCEKPGHSLVNCMILERSIEKKAIVIFAKLLRIHLEIVEADAAPVR
ncbi:hypothetical protein QAD02_008409 [Eretmocerus hayati]|uniref:Uncharacterized protein n=1 Tax=Eretmocerus hayati TaxID=131215 RepID=A0ACC2N8S3_9HYME|nr:hypothetical protein QAD02_008409 [Eretmocerus hayati]